MPTLHSKEHPVDQNPAGLPSATVARALLQGPGTDEHSFSEERPPSPVPTAVPTDTTPQPVHSAAPGPSDPDVCNTLRHAIFQLSRELEEVLREVRDPHCLPDIKLQPSEQ